jgi:Uma2 family endonuclease
MAYAQPRAWTIQEFLTFESEEPERYELVGGVVRLRTGDTAAHSAIKGNVALAFHDALRGAPWRPYICGLKVLTPTAVLYPDVLVARRPLASDDDRLSDPTVVVEILSPASETFDRISKWREYQRIASLRDYILIEQKERRIEVWSRTAAAGSW